jgi:hypothetical protein
MHSRTMHDKDSLTYTWLCSQHPVQLMCVWKWLHFTSMKTLNSPNSIPDFSLSCYFILYQGKRANLSISFQFELELLDYINSRKLVLNETNASGYLMASIPYSLSHILQQRVHWSITFMSPLVYYQNL